MKQSYFLPVLLLVLLSCNREKHNSKKLMKGENWEVKNITIDGTSLGVFGNWAVTQDVKIYDSVPGITWTAQNCGSSIFEWQFHDKAKSFDLNYYQLCSECQGEALDSLDYITHDLSGKYKVERHGSRKMKFSSSATNSYPGKKVVISIERR